jgi:hypothetical protein
MPAILDRGRCPDKHPPTLHSSVGSHSYDHNVASELPPRDGRIGSWNRAARRATVAVDEHGALSAGLWRLSAPRFCRYHSIDSTGGLRAIISEDSGKCYRA